MKIFIWERVYKLTDNYHPEGGLVVIAETLEQARVLAQSKGVTFTDVGDDWDRDSNVIKFEIVANESQVFIFPDAGCC